MSPEFAAEHRGFLLAKDLFQIATGVAWLAGAWGIFRKAGQPGWAALVPGYDVWVLFRITGISGWWMASLLLPFVAGPLAAPVVIGLFVFVNLRLAKSFGQDAGFAIIGLTFLAPIFWCMLGFGNYQYKEPTKAS